MKIELKNMNRSPRIPGAFIGFLYIEGHKAALVWNRGPGYNTGYHQLDETGRTLLAAAELHCRAKLLADQGSSQDQPLAALIDRLAGDYESKRKKGLDQKLK